MGETINKRLYVGGLNRDVSSNEILERFSRFGKVSNLSITRRTDNEGNQIKSFAHLDLEGNEANIKKCFSTYQNTKWKGSVLKLQYAKESFLTKLEKEREDPIQNQIDSSPKVSLSPRKPDFAKSLPTVLEVKGSAVPGTPVPGKKDWVVGKYGRVLPVLNLKKSYKLKMIKHDPSKYCHAAKVFKDDKANELINASCDKLTWEINTPDSEITRKRKGEFPERSQSEKKKKWESPSLNTQRKSFGTEDSNQRDQSFSNKLRSLQTERDSGEFEIVKSGALNKAQTSATTQKKNRFDSDVDSDSEVVSTSFRIARVEKEKSVQPKKVPKPPHQGSKEKRVLDAVLEKSNHTSVTEGQTSVNKRVNGLDTGTDRKVPEFKGLQMLGLNTSKSERTPQKKTQVHNSVLEKSDVKSPSRSSFDKNVSCASDTGVNIKPGNNKHHTVSNTMKVIPEFRGLSMLFDRSDTGNRSSSQCRTNAPADVTQQQPSAKTQKQTLSQSFSGETGKSSLSSNKESLASSRETKVKSLSSNASGDLPAASKEKHVMEGYDSASSADTDEILARCRSKQGFLSSSHKPFASTPSGDLNATSLSARNVSQTAGASSRTGTTSLLDQSLYLSEITAGTPELSSISPRDLTSANVIQNRSCDDSSDSDLDSNDFELVAKKLAEKAARTSKFGNVNAHQKLRNEALSMKVDHFKSENTRQRRTETDPHKDEGGANKAKPSLQNKLMDIANGYKSDTSAAATSLRGQVENLAQEPETKKVKITNKSSVVDSLKQNETSQKSKHMADNEKRLQAVKEHLKQKQQQQNLMKKALQNVDVQENSSSKRTVFSSSEDENSDEGGDEDDNDDNMKDASEDKPKADPGAKERGKKQKQEHSKEKSRLVLLENSSGDEEESDYEEMFKSKPHFEGKRGERLMKLERKIGDSRFRLDAKFAESDSDDEEETQSKEKLSEKKAEVDPSLEEEKAASLKVLENVIGKTALDQFSEKIKRNTKYLIDMNAVRFDPTKIVSQKNSASSTDKKVTAKLEFSPPSNKHIKKDEHGKREEEGGKLLKDLQKKTKGNEKEMPGTDKGKAETTVDGLKEKPAVKKSQRVSTEQGDEKSNANVGSKSTVHLASSLVDLFKRKQDNDDEEEPQTFSLLQQFDAGGEDESDSTSESEDASDDNRGKVVKGKTPAVLSGLFTKAEQEKKASVKEVATSLPSPSLSSGEHPDSESEEVKEDLNDGRKIGFPGSLSEEETSEESEEEELMDMDEGLPCAIQEEEMGSRTELSNAGRVDVRYTKEQWLQKWEEIRPSLVKMYKRKHKDALKNKRAQSQMKRKREFLNKSRKGHMTRRTR